MFDRVLAPVDFSDDARASARLAWCLTADGGQLEILHVDDIPDLSVMSSEPLMVARRAWHAIREQHAAEFGRKLEEVVAHIAEQSGGRSGPEIDAVIRTGDVVETILQEARGGPAELLVIGSHGESGSVRYLFGSVAAKLSRGAPCPVLVTRPGKAAELASRGRFDRVLVAVDHSPFSVPAARLGRRIAASDHRIQLLHVWQPPAGISLQFTGERRNYQGDRMARLMEAAGLDDRDAEPLVDVGHPTQRLLEHVEKHRADLLVIGAHGREGLVEKVIGTTADRLLRHADVPVLLIPQESTDNEEAA